jgi:hypothetical protein
MREADTLFSWSSAFHERDPAIEKSIEWEGIFGALRNHQPPCPCCGEAPVRLVNPSHRNRPGFFFSCTYDFRCPLCGWWFHHIMTQEFSWDTFQMSVLKRFDPGSCEPGLVELRSRLERERAHAFSARPEWLAGLAREVFGDHGFDLVLTAVAGDGDGTLLVLHDAPRSLAAIVECQRNRQDASLDVIAAPALVLAAIDWDGERAHLVSTTRSFPGRGQRALDFRSRGVAVELAALADLAALLGVYNTGLPALHELTPDERLEIARRNRSRS